MRAFFHEEITCLVQFISDRKRKLRIVCNSISVKVYQVVAAAKAVALRICKCNIDNRTFVDLLNPDLRRLDC